MSSDTRMVERKTYIGDGVYLEIEPYGDVVLTTENGIYVTNRIVLEPSVWSALTLVVNQMHAMMAEARRPDND